MITIMGHKEILKKKNKINSYFLRYYFSFTGFTLLEIMIALAIIGSFLTVIIYTVNYHADVSFKNAETTQMFQLAKENLTEMETNPRDSSGAFAGTGFSFINTVNEIGEPGIIEIRSVISTDKREISLSELIKSK
jgi:prepilin-type N-terminal cleavage/methylation domain-containing protein